MGCAAAGVPCLCGTFWNDSSSIRQLENRLARPRLFAKTALPIPRERRSGKDLEADREKDGPVCEQSFLATGQATQRPGRSSQWHRWSAAVAVRRRKIRKIF